GAVRGLVADRHGTLWVATSGGVYRWHAQADAFEPVSADNATAIVEDAAGRLWIAGGDHTIRLLARQDGGSSGSPIRLPGSPPVASLVHDRFGTVWTGTVGRGLFRTGADATP